MGIFAEKEEGYFALTKLSACLQSDVPGSVRAMAITLGEEHYKAWGDILYTLRTGSSAFEHVYGMPVFQYYDQNPESGKIFNEAMTSGSAAEKAEVLKSYDFSQFRKLVDIGGGQGTFIAAVLKANPNLQGGKLHNLANDRYPHIKPTTVKEYLAATNIFDGGGVTEAGYTINWHETMKPMQAK